MIEPGWKANAAHSASGRTQELFQQSQNSIFRRTDRLFAGLLIFQWLAGIVLAFWISPKTWAGSLSATHIHVWSALFLGGVISAFPVYLGMIRPGHVSTRHAIAIGQMLMGALLIHLTGGRIETHFHVFGSLAFLAFYRDWRVLVTGTAVVAIDHLLRGMFFPRSVYGVLSVTVWRTLEHAGWVVFEDIFLIHACVQGRRELQEIASRQADLENTHQEIEARVCQRTEELAASRHELEMTNEELRRARDEALDAARLKSQFLANMSHEIRTPMNGVIGMITLLLDTTLSAEQTGYAETVRSSAEALLTVINDVLDFSKIEAGKLELDETDVDLNQIVEEVADLLSGQAHSKGLELTCLVDPGVPRTVRCASSRIRQVLTNLVGNALKFTEHGEVSIEVQRTGEREDGKALVEFRIRDTGIGMPPDVQSRLFQAFMQADGSTSRRHGGTGLGLAISRRLTELMGGEIHLESAPGEGSTFWFSIPLTPLIGGAEPPTTSRTGLSGLRVLVVDDNRTNLRVLQHSLKYWGVETELADSGRAALVKLKGAVHAGRMFDLAILDFAMPEMDGIQLAAAMRQEKTTQSIPLILLTSYVDRKYRELAMSAGFSAYLTKPVRKAQLDSSILAVLGRGGLQVDQKVSDEPRLTEHFVSGARLLVAEDNPVNQKVASHILKTLGYDCEVVNNGSEALTALSRTTYDLILMDIQMPVMDGFQATAEIRRREGELGHPIVIAMTAHAMKGDREMCVAAGMDDYICKPIKRDELRATLMRWLQGKGQFDRGRIMPDSPSSETLTSQYG